MPSWQNSDKKPCGTMAAVRRHYRHGEPLCRACKQAEQRNSADQWSRQRAWEEKRISLQNDVMKLVEPYGAIDTLVMTPGQGNRRELECDMRVQLLLSPGKNPDNEREMRSELYLQAESLAEEMLQHGFSFWQPLEIKLTSDNGLVVGFVEVFFHWSE